MNASLVNTWLDRRIVFRFLVGARDFFLRQNARSTLGVHTTSYLMGTSCLSPGVKQPGGETTRLHLLPSWRKTEAALALPCWIDQASVSPTFPFRMDCTVNGRDISKLSVSDLPTLIVTLPDMSVKRHWQSCLCNYWCCTVNILYGRTFLNFVHESFEHSR